MADAPQLSAAGPRAPWWPHLRVLFVVFHVTAVAIGALPSTSVAMKRSAWEDPTVQAEFAAWAPHLGVSVPELSDRLWTFARGWNKVETTISTPFSPYLKAVHANQSWQMFVAPHTFPTRLQLQDRHGDGPWETLYEEQSPTARWHVDMLRVERMRASIFRWGWPSYAAAYKSACHAFAGLRFAEDASVTRFRCRFSKARTPSAGEVLAGKVPPAEWLAPVEVAR